MVHTPLYDSCPMVHGCSPYAMCNSCHHCPPPLTHTPLTQCQGTALECFSVCEHFSGVLWVVEGVEHNGGEGYQCKGVLSLLGWFYPQFFGVVLLLLFGVSLPKWGFRGVLSPVCVGRVIWD